MISELRDQVRGETLEFAWSQWVQLGISGQRTRSDRWAIDPEALLLLTCEVGRRDPRLFDEMLDWLLVNHRFLSLQRLRNLRTRFPIDPRIVEAIIDWVGETASTPRWHSTKQLAQPGSMDPMELFASDVVSLIPDPDPVFARHGIIRPRVAPSSKSSQPEVREAISLALRLRLLFGTGSRAEVIRFLLTTSEKTVDTAAIADEAAYAKRNVSETLTALVQTAVVKSRWSANERVFRVFPNKWTDLLEIGPTASSLPTYVPWGHVLAAISYVLQWLEVESVSGASDYLLSSRARDLVDQMRPLLDAAGLPPPGRLGAQASFMPAFEDLVDRLMQTLRPAGRPDDPS